MSFLRGLHHEGAAPAHAGVDDAGLALLVMWMPDGRGCGGGGAGKEANGCAEPGSRGLHSSTSQLNLSRFDHTSPYPPV